VRTWIVIQHTHTSLHSEGLRFGYLTNSVTFFGVFSQIWNSQLVMKNPSS
jgi:hypothetical protein